MGWVRKTATHPLVLLHIFSSPHAAHATRGKPRGDERHVQTVQVGRFHQKERVREEVEKHATNFLERNYEEIVSYLFGFSKNCFAVCSAGKIVQCAGSPFKEMGRCKRLPFMYPFNKV